jgi:hypothetical protein
MAPPKLPKCNYPNECLPSCVYCNLNNTYTRFTIMFQCNTCRNLLEENSHNHCRHCHRHLGYNEWGFVTYCIACDAIIPSSDDTCVSCGYFIEFGILKQERKMLASIDRKYCIYREWLDDEIKTSLYEQAKRMVVLDLRSVKCRSHKPGRTLNFERIVDSDMGLKKMRARSTHLIKLRTKHQTLHTRLCDLMIDIYGAHPRTW